MDVVYPFMRRLLGTGLEIYFLDIEAVGQEYIPAQGPVIFAANHPNSIMDTFILGSQTDRRIGYLARAGLFDYPGVGALFRSLGAIPIYRQDDKKSAKKDKKSGGGGEASPPKASSDNEDTFRKAYEVLAEGGTIGIFPEGRNSFERKIRPLKTGTARIALGAEQSYDYKLGVKIIPVGLNFENRDKFLSRVLVRFGAPIDALAYAAQHKADDREAVRELTATIEEAIQQLATHIEDNQTLSMVRDISKIYGRELFDSIQRAELTDRTKLEVEEEFDIHFTGPIALDDEFKHKRLLADALEHFKEHDPARVDALLERIQIYRDHLNQVELRLDFGDRDPSRLSSRREALNFTLYAIAYALPAAWGFAHNALPYWIPRVISLRLRSEAKRALTAFLIGNITFVGFYSFYVYALYRSELAWPWILLYMLSLPPAGFFFLRYRAQLVRYRDRILARTLFRTERNLCNTLLRERERLVIRFNELLEDYRQDQDRARIDGSNIHASGEHERLEQPS